MLTNLKYLRKEASLSQKQVAEILHISQQTYSDYENCKTEPTNETLMQIARLFDITLDELLGYELPTPEEKAAGASATKKESISPIEYEMLYRFREVGRKRGIDAQQSIIDMIDKML